MAFILTYLHKIIIISLICFFLTAKDNLKVHWIVGVSSMNICFREILWDKNQTHTMLEVKEQKVNILQIKRPTDWWVMASEQGPRITVSNNKTLGVKGQHFHGILNAGVFLWTWSWIMLLMEFKLRKREFWFRIRYGIDISRI